MDDTLAYMELMDLMGTIHEERQQLDDVLCTTVQLGQLHEQVSKEGFNLESLNLVLDADDAILLFGKPLDQCTVDEALEGITDAVVKGVKKAIDAVVQLIKKIWNMITGLFKKIDDKSTKKEMEQAKDAKPEKLLLETEVKAYSIGVLQRIEQVTEFANNQLVDAAKSVEKVIDAVLDDKPESEWKVDFLDFTLATDSGKNKDNPDTFVMCEIKIKCDLNTGDFSKTQAIVGKVPGQMISLKDSGYTTLTEISDIVTAFSNCTDALKKVGDPLDKACTKLDKLKAKVGGKEPVKESTLEATRVIVHYINSMSLITGKLSKACYMGYVVMKAAGAKVALASTSKDLKF